MCMEEREISTTMKRMREDGTKESKSKRLCRRERKGGVREAVGWRE